MKRFIKTFSIMLFVLFTFGITISNAYSSSSYMRNFNAPTYSVNTKTKATDMLNALNANPTNKNLTGINGNVKDNNPYIYCRQRYYALWGGAGVYETGIGRQHSNWEKFKDPITYPGIDKDNDGKIEKNELTNESNVYAKAYIFANDKFSKHDKQWAWYHELGSASENNLNKVADEYQNYKNNEILEVINNAGEEVIMDGENAVYGPIVIKYNYVKASNNEEWGGINYLFFDEKNNPIDINTINLYTKETNTYKKINSTKITQSGSSNGYYKITENTYNGKDLYVVTKSKDISTARLVIQGNQIEYIAEVQYVYGERYVKEECQVLCDDCNSLESQNAGWEGAIESQSGFTYTVDGMFYRYSAQKQESIGPLSSTPIDVVRVFSVDGTTRDINVVIRGNPSYGTLQYKMYNCDVCGTVHGETITKKNHWSDADFVPVPLASSKVSLLGEKKEYNKNQSNSEKEVVKMEVSQPVLLGAAVTPKTYKCLGCPYEGVSQADVEGHIRSNHMTNAGAMYKRKVYEFRAGCGADMGDKCSDCGTRIPVGYYESQGLVIVKDSKIENPITEELNITISFGMQIPVKKVWNDSNNQDGIRPDSIQVTLYGNGTKVTTGVNGEPVTNPIILNKDNGWAGRFTGLDRETFEDGSVTYTIKEEGLTGVPNSYEIQSISPEKISKTQGNPDVGFTITNKHDLELVEIPITKVWDDDSDRDKIRPESVKINLYADGVKVDTITISGTNEENEWSGQFPSSGKKLYKYKEGAQGVLIKYTIEEETITKTHQYNKSQKYDAPKYTTSSESQANPSTTCGNISGTKSYHDSLEGGKPETLSGFTVINTHIPEKVEIPITKKWDDDDDRDGIRPSSIFVKLYSDDPKEEQPVQRREIKGEKTNDTWTYTFTSTESEPINKYRHNGVLINYWVEEEPITNSQSYDESQAYAVPKYTTSSTSQENAEETCGKIQGTITYNNSAAEKLSGFTIINTHIPEKVKIIVKKIWDDDNNRDNVRPNQIVFVLKADGAELKKDAFGKTITNPVTLNDENEWTYTYEDLCRYRDHGVEIEYTIDETTTPQYYTKKINQAEKVYDQETQIQTITLSITNKHELELVEFDITKIWDDETDRDGLRPANIKINLYADGTKVDSITISGKNTENTWKGHFPSSNSVKIYKYKQGEQGVLIKYTIGEETIPNAQPYDAKQRYDDPQYTISSTSQENASTTCESISGTTGYHDSVNGGKPQILSGFTVINKHIPEKLQIIIKKIWDDDNNRDNVRTGEVVFVLKADGTKLEVNAFGEPITNPATLNNANKWTYTYEKLYRYRDHGTEINYTIEENTTPPYYYQTGMGKSASYATGSQVITLSITNKHDLELVEFDVTKAWDDDTDRDGLRPGSITLNLYADGKAVDKITIEGTNTNNTWSGHFPSSNEVKLYKYKEGAQGVLIKYTIGEEKITNAQPYDETQKYDAPKYSRSSTSQANASTTCGSISGTKGYHDSVNDGKPEILSGFTVINKHTPEKMKVTVTKIWDDMDDLDEYRPQYITCTLLSNENGGATRAKHAATGNTGNRSNVGDIKVQDPISTGEKYSDTWGEETVENLYRYYNHGTPIVYTIQEKPIPHYNENDENGNNKVKPESRVYYNGSGTNAANPKVEITDCDHTDPKTEANKVVAITISNKHTPHYDGYVEITGRVWNDGAAGKGNDLNGLMDQGESGLKGIKVTLKNADGTDFKCGDRTYKTETDNNGNYTIRVNIDEAQKVYKMYESPQSLATRLATAYVEFEYDGGKYTTVANKAPASNASTAVEDTEQRGQFDTNNTLVTKDTNPNSWKAPATVTADTVEMDSFKINGKYNQEGRDVTVKYCTGDEYLQTNPDGAWNEILTSNKYMSPTEHPDHTTCSGSHSMSKFKIQITKIQNVNLGLFEREQPYIALFSDLSKVEVEMLGQKYTYLYNVRSKESNNVGLKVKFENKDTYTYRRPVNPADIAYINEKAENKDAMNVTVTYEVKVGNLSTTLPITVHNIVNSFDSRYTLTSAGWTTTTTGQFSQAKNNGDLNIRVEPQTESEAIQLTYTVSVEAIRGLLTQQATLNNAVEIASYSTRYGSDTLYAEQQTGGRTGQAYGGYDFNSHPENAGIFINGAGRLEAARPEPDTDIAPSFVLDLDRDTPDDPNSPIRYKVLSGNVWEDTDKDNGSGSGNFRLGNGKKEASEKNLAKAKVELYKVKDDGTVETTPATMYKIVNGTLSTMPAVTYSNENGYYSFGNNGTDIANRCGVMTDKYMIKFTYGVGIDGTITSTINGKEVDARNYKSTIIAEGTQLYDVFKGNSSSEEWHLNLGKSHSIAVDDMEKRVKMSDLQYSNFGEKSYITANSKPFKMQVEFDASENKTSQVPANGETLFGNELDIFDFGIIERAREDLYAEKTIEYLKITLANGQVLTEGNPTVQELRYAKPIGFGEPVESGEAARRALDKQISIEIDSELIQGAQLDIKYAIRVTNNSEKDYDYYVGDDRLAYDPTKLRTEYYYFGTNNERSPEIKGSVNYLADYIDKDLTFQWENAGDWMEISANDLNAQGFISENTKKAINVEDYKPYVTTKFRDLQPGHSMTEYAYGSKLLSNQDETVYENHMEILQIDSKTARTLKGKEADGSPIYKDYKMGNYVPSLEARVISTDITKEEPGLHEQDDDRVKVIITTPTGVTNYTIPYVIATLVGLIVMVSGVIFIKKKILKK